MDIETEAIALVKDEKSSWENATAFVTEKVAFNMRNLIRTLRKNYYGVFDEPNDTQTGRKKIWVPMTENVCETFVKSIDLDQKDVNFRAKKAEALGLTALVRNVVRNRLSEINFGEKLDDLERRLAIDGTAVWKTIEGRDETGKKTMNIVPVDLLNLYIDPTASNIQETQSVIERSVMTVDELKSMDGWDDTDDIEGRPNIPKNDERVSRQSGSKVKMVEVFERWGKMPKSLLTGKDKDKDTLVNGHIVVSSLEQGPRVHLIEENTLKDAEGNSLKPYEEAFATRVPGRWYGRGAAEKVMFLQVWLNTIVNIRITRSYVSQLGLFKIKKGSGVTPQLLSRLTVNGAVVLNNMDDLEQLVTQEASMSSYNDEDRSIGWADRVTNSFEAVTGETLPGSTPATTAVLQQRSAQSYFTVIKEGIGFFLQRWMKRHALPLLMKNLKPSDVLRITGEVEELREQDQRVVLQLAYMKMEEMNKKGEIFNVDDVPRVIADAIAKRQSMGRDRFAKLMKRIDYSKYDVEIYVTNEELDKSVAVQNLLGVLQTIPAIPNANVDPAMVVRQIFDLMGLDVHQLSAPKNPLLGGAPQAPVAPPPAQAGEALTAQAPVEGLSATPLETRIAAQANTL